MLKSCGTSTGVFCNSKKRIKTHLSFRVVSRDEFGPKIRKPIHPNQFNLKFDWLIVGRLWSLDCSKLAYAGVENHFQRFWNWNVSWGMFGWGFAIWKEVDECLEKVGEVFQQILEEVEASFQKGNFQLLLTPSVNGDDLQDFRHQ